MPANPSLLAAGCERPRLLLISTTSRRTVSLTGLHGEGVGRVIGPEVGRGEKKSPQQRPGIVGAGERFAHFTRQGALGAVGDHFYRVDKVFTFRAQLGEEFRRVALAVGGEGAARRGGRGVRCRTDATLRMSGTSNASFFRTNPD